MEGKIQELENEVASLKEKPKAQEVIKVEIRVEEPKKIDELVSLVPKRRPIDIEQTDAIMEIEAPNQNNQLKVDVLKGMLYHKLEILKKVSQQVHNIFISLQNAGHVCDEALAMLNPIFNQWAPYNHFFDSLIILMSRKTKLPDKIFMVKESLEIVKELIGFFTIKS